VKWLADTNILLRSVQTSHPMYDDTARAVNLLTFNTADFKRFTTITAVNPQSILSDEVRST
jgi:predicted nucleic acid-binding protein